MKATCLCGKEFDHPPHPTCTCQTCKDIRKRGEEMVAELEAQEKSEPELFAVGAQVTIVSDLEW